MSASMASENTCRLINCLLGTVPAAKPEYHTLAEPTPEEEKILSSVDAGRKPAKKPAAPVKDPEPVKEDQKKEAAAPTITRLELKAYCAHRKSEGINVTEIIKAVAGVQRFSAIPDDMIQTVYEAVKNA